MRKESNYQFLQLAMTFHKRERVTESLKKSLTALKLDYVDLFLIHIPCGAQVSLIPL